MLSVVLARGILEFLKASSCLAFKSFRAAGIVLSRREVQIRTQFEVQIGTQLVDETFALLNSVEQGVAGLPSENSTVSNPSWDIEAHTPHVTLKREFEQNEFQCCHGAEMWSPW